MYIVVMTDLAMSLVTELDVFESFKSCRILHNVHILNSNVVVYYMHIEVSPVIIAGTSPQY